ncbi:MAG: hypothetical protein R3E91_00095 [Chlamydiales bacterium]
MERKKNIAEIKRLIKEKKDLYPLVGRSIPYQKNTDSKNLSLSYFSGFKDSKPYVEKESRESILALTHFLLSKGISQKIIQKITLPFLGKSWSMDELKNSLVKEIETVGDLAVPNRLALVGPTGVGKTTTIMKLAKYYSHRDKTVAIVELNKKAHYSQLKHYSDQEGIAYYQSLNKVEGDLILIDTEGCNFYQSNQIDNLGEQLSSFRPVEILLTLSAATKEVDLYGAIHQFSPLCPNSLIFTKLDETLTSGILINIASKTDLPIRYITSDFPLPGKVEIANPYKIIHKILTEFNKKEFNQIRYLSLYN